MINAFLFNGGILFAVVFLFFYQTHDLSSQTRGLDQITPPLSQLQPSEPSIDKTALELVDSIKATNILSLIRTLSSDSFEGRATGSKGFNKAADYVMQLFQDNDFRPIGRSYFQKFKIDTKTVWSRVHVQGVPEDSVESMNVIGIKEGTSRNNEFVVITAHLDHLGMKPDSIYHGANDNASGVAVMLTMAQVLKNIPTDRSVVLIAFTGEEIGLSGSAHFVTHAPIDLKAIKLLINLDLVGSGKNGIMVQGIDGHTAEWSEIQKINDRYFGFELGTRPNSPNSDQYYFHLLGVPAFFLYAYNGTMPYHSPGDTADKIDSTVVENVAKFVLMNVWKAASDE